MKTDAPSWDRLLRDYQDIELQRWKDSARSYPVMGSVSHLPLLSDYARSLPPYETKTGYKGPDRKQLIKRLIFCELREKKCIGDGNKKWAEVYQDEASRIRRRLHPQKRQPSPLRTEIRAELGEWVRLAHEREAVEDAPASRLDALIASF